ncbi:alanine/ornithine racemase family PLP-dependent enzyme [Marinoscillum pacificum]|uniref:alanine/ornithine racemase family PLP-dependent enzyme n=1 Tax=Marinoscillum pacificum TaxID=392723 RepID=UPI00215722C7|nr:alanine/ornithine racemase family PLP-dependent enzyme [Marinoscillum pacificum]
MAYLKLRRRSLQHNYNFLSERLEKEGIEWGVVSKLLCGTEKYIQELLNLGVTEIHDSRISNLKKVKALNPEVQTVYIKPPAGKAIKNVVKYADVSFNSELSTIKLLSEEAGKQNKLHKIIIMIEMGDLREGVLGEHLLEFYGKIFELPNITVVGLGTNLNCLYGVMPSQDKLIQLSLYKQLVEAKFNRKIEWVSGGTSVTFPLLLNRQLPKGINHFRIGEMLYFGNNLFTEKSVPGMKTDVFTLHAQIIELIEKPKVPTGELAANPSGEQFEINEEDYGKTSYRAILDLGLLDISTDFLEPIDKGVEVTGASSDMIVVDLGSTKRNYKVGDWIKFKLKYMGALGLLNSNYIDKIVE